MPSLIQVLFTSFSASLGVVFNGYILFVFFWNRKIHTANRLLLLHLAFVDTVFCLVILLYNTSLSVIFTTSAVTFGLTPKPSTSALKDWQATVDSRLCQSHGIIWTLLPVVVVWNVCALSCDRYAAISIPLHYSRLVNTRKALHFVVISWILGVSLGLPPLLGVCPYEFWDARFACTANCMSSTTASGTAYAATYAMLALGFPLTIILFCNLHSLFISKYHRNRIASAIYQVTINAQATVTHQRNPCYLSKFKGKSAFFTIAQVVGSLLLLVLPYHGVLLWEAVKNTECNSMIVAASTSLLTCLPAINAYVYGVKSRMLRQTLKKLLRQQLFTDRANDKNKRLKARLAEIFSETKRPPLFRRMSAPADLSRQTNIQHFNESPHQDASSNLRAKFACSRSTSLPMNVILCHPKMISVQSGVVDNNTTDSHRTMRRTRPPLQKSQSAPEEEIVPCDLPQVVIKPKDRILDSKNEPDCDPQTSHYFTRRKTFTRSLTFPETQRLTFLANKRLRFKMSTKRKIESSSIEEENALSPNSTK